MIYIKSPEQLQGIRKACQLTALILNELKAGLKPGITTAELEERALSLTKKYDVRLAFKGYNGYPAHICTSVNEVVVHGIPTHRCTLKSGDIVGIDVGVEADGFFGDAAITVGVGEISAQAQKLIDVTEKSLYIGIDKAKSDNRLSDISNAIQTYVESNSFSVVRQFVGHGIGLKLHEEPQIPNFGPAGYGPRLREAMVFAIEPMVNMGGPGVEILEDGWTAVTKDKSLSAHFEHTILIAKEKAEILTVCQKKNQYK